MTQNTERPNASDALRIDVRRKTKRQKPGKPKHKSKGKFPKVTKSSLKTIRRLSAVSRRKSRGEFI